MRPLRSPARLLLTMRRSRASLMLSSLALAVNQAEPSKIQFLSAF
jgi:hypothetical protein